MSIFSGIGEYLIEAEDQNSLASSLQKGLGLLSGSDATFAKSLLAWFKKTMFFSPKQLFHVKKLVGYIKNGYPSNSNAGCSGLPAGSCTSIYDFLAASKLKYPRVMLSKGDFTICIKKAWDNSKYAGSLIIDNVNAAGCYGFIYPSGAYVPTKYCADVVCINVSSILTMANMDLVGCIKEFGSLTGKCSFCMKKLDDPVSKEMGYGPVCAKNNGLAYGAGKYGMKKTIVKKVKTKPVSAFWHKDFIITPHQVEVGAEEYAKAAKVANTEPKSSYKVVVAKTYLF